MQISSVIAIWSSKLWFGSPCTSRRRADVWKSLIILVYLPSFLLGYFVTYYNFKTDPFSTDETNLKILILNRKATSVMHCWDREFEGNWKKQSFGNELKIQIWQLKKKNVGKIQALVALQLQFLHQFVRIIFSFTNGQLGHIFSIFSELG